MRVLMLFALGCVPFLVGLDAAESTLAQGDSSAGRGQVKIVDFSDSLIQKASARDDSLGRLLHAAKPTIGVSYDWGGTRLGKGIDCSNYTWQLFGSVGRPYRRFVSTMAMSRLTRSNGMRKVTWEDAKAGDLLVYGYRDESKKWHGHVVILVDKDGRVTGHQGLVLGAHGGEVNAVQFVTFTGFDHGYFKDPKMRLCNVLRVEESGLARSISD